MKASDDFSSGKRGAVVPPSNKKNTSFGYDSDTEWVSSEEFIAPEVEEYKTPGLALQGARLKNNLSPTALAKLIGIRPESMSKLENGKRPIGVGLAKKFAEVLNVDYHSFLP